MKFFSIILSVIVTVISIVQIKVVDSIDLTENDNMMEQSLIDVVWKDSDAGGMRHNQDALEVAKGTEIIEDYKEYVTEDSDDEKAEMIDDIYDEISVSDTIDNCQNIEVRYVDKKDIIRNESYVVMDTAEEIVDFLEKKQNVLEDGEILQNMNEDQQYCAMQLASNNIVTKNKGYQRGTPVLHYNLFADIKYNKKTGVISSVKNRKFTITGLTICTTAEDRSYTTSYSKSKKSCTIRCNYTDVTQLLTPWGAIQIYRKSAYQKFSWNLNKGVYNGKGGYR
ncbi:MAG: hypothetical protein HFH62_07480 [Lachnospiraceae bacterium]|nr:hypothetical protein [Lachnospiraceae bacterium]